MLAYAKLQMGGNAIFAQCQSSIKEINASLEAHKRMGIRLDQIGMSWLIDTENSIIWHDGGTGDYNSYVGFDRDSGVAVVVLSNLSPRYRISGTVLGVKAFAEWRH